MGVLYHSASFPSFAEKYFPNLAFAISLGDQGHGLQSLANLDVDPAL